MENTPRIAQPVTEEENRVHALQRYQIMDTAPERSFNNIAKLAAQFFNLPFAMITFIDMENVFLKAAVGMEVSKSPRSNSLCTLAIVEDGVSVFDIRPDMDPCVLANAAVAAESGLKFYAGAPITTTDGFRIGTVCVMGLEARSFSKKEEDLLENLAVIVMDEIELRLQGKREAEKDLLTAIHQAQLNYNNQSLIAHAPVAIAILKGRELTIEIANIKILEVWGKTDSIIGKPIKEALPELEGQPYLQIFDDVFTSGKPFYGNELPAALIRNGQLEDAYFNFVYQPLKDVSGSTISIMIVATEITEQIKARKLLQESEKQLENMVMSSTAGMVIFKGKELIVETVNQRILDIWEKNADEVIGKSLFHLLPHHTSECYPDPMLNVFDSRQPISFTEIEAIFPSPDAGKSYFLNITYFPVIDEAGEVNHIMVSLNDVTAIVKARKLSEQTAIEQKAANETLIKAIEEFATANRELLSTNKDLKQTHEILKNTLSELPSGNS